MPDIHEIGGWLSLGLVIAAAIVYIIRAKTLQTILNEWKDLATVKAQKIAELESRIANLEHELAVVRAENEELRHLNLNYQTRIAMLEAKFEV